MILQPDNAKLMNVDLTGVAKLIIYIDKVGGKNDDCVDIADAKVYVKEDDNTPDQPSKDELEEIKNKLREIAAARGVSYQLVVLAWELAKGDHVFVFPGAHRP